MIGTGSRRRVLLVQQGVRDMRLESMPLAAGYLKAVAMADADIRQEMDVEILNLSGGLSTNAIVQRVLGAGIPDVLALSVFGWNLPTFGFIAETFRQLNPDGLVIFGGTHVAHQAERIFRIYPEVDIIVNGEGEFVFRDLLRAFLGNGRAADLSGITGISYHRGDGEIQTTAPRDRIEDLDSIPSPVLTGAIDVCDERGQFRYDVALMETNRGCPYRCSFCYWGGAIGQRIRCFSRERLQEELELFGYHKVHTVVLCDANFGLIKNDALFLEDLIKTREKYGYPRSLESSWAKNKSKVFFDIVRRMKQVGLRSSFTLALQTMNPETLKSMQRTNMGINEWEGLLDWLADEGFDAYAELIWGAPGETSESFLAGYDTLARHASRIATYPLLILPNTEYQKRRDDFGLVTVRGDRDDFEYVVAHNEMTIQENQEMQRFLFWARTVGENSIFRHIWAPLREMVGLSQSQVLLSMAEWFDRSDAPAAEPLKTDRPQLMVDAGAVSDALLHIYSDPEVQPLFQAWWDDEIAPLTPHHLRAPLSELFAYDQITRPVLADPELEIVDVQGVAYYVRRNVRFNYEFPMPSAKLQQGPGIGLDPVRTTLDLYYKVGFSDHIDSHELAFEFAGVTRGELLEKNARALESVVGSGGSSGY